MIYRRRFTRYTYRPARLMIYTALCFGCEIYSADRRVSRGVNNAAYKAGIDTYTTSFYSCHAPPTKMTSFSSLVVVLQSGKMPAFQQAEVGGRSRFCFCQLCARMPPL